jgi:ABC-type sugar transport system ATPase subunit
LSRKNIRHASHPGTSDVGNKAEIYALFDELALAGIPILIISSDLPEVLALADRILVMRHGRITGELTRAEATEEKIIHLAALGSDTSRLKSEVPDL